MQDEGLSMYTQKTVYCFIGESYARDRLARAPPSGPLADHRLGGSGGRTKEATGMVAIPAMHTAGGMAVLPWMIFGRQRSYGTGL